MNRKKGQVLVLGVLAIVVLLGFTGIVVDASLIYIDVNRMQTIADQAAIAGAANIGDGVTTATNKALEITGANGISDSDVTITTPYTITADPGNPKYEAGDTSYDSNDLLRVQIQATHNYTFGKLFGLNSRDITVSSVAIYPGDPESVTGVTPTGIAEQTFVYGNTYEIKEQGGTGSSNQGPIRLGGPGADNWRDNMEYGYTGTVSIGDNVDTEPGKMAGPTTQAVDYLIGEDTTGTFASHSDTSPRVLLVPICNPDPQAGNGLASVQIVSFALFWLVGEGSSSSVQAQYIGPATVGNWGQATITGENGSYTRLVQ